MQRRRVTPPSGREKQWTVEILETRIAGGCDHRPTDTDMFRQPKRRQHVQPSGSTGEEILEVLSTDADHPEVGQRSHRCGSFAVMEQSNFPKEILFA